MTHRTPRQIASVLALACILAAPTLTFAQSAEEILARFDDEPTVLEVQQAAMIYAGVEPERIDGWYDRANMAAVLPDVVEYRFRLRDDDRTTDRFTEDINPDGTGLGAEDRREERGTTLLEHDVRVRWDFSELVFNPDVLRAAREVGRQTKQREDLLTTVTKLYYEHRRAQIQMLLEPPTDAADRLRKDLRIQELTADLDALTGSWYSAELRRAGKAPY